MAEIPELSEKWKFSMFEKILLPEQIAAITSDVSTGLMPYTLGQNMLIQCIEALREQLAEAEADVRALAEALAWAHDAIWTAQTKSADETLDTWLSKQAGWPDRFLGFTAALDSVLTRPGVRRVMEKT